MEIYERIERIAVYKKIKTRRDLIQLVMNQNPILKRTGEPPSEKTVYAYLSGTRNMDSGLLVSVCKALQVSESVVLSGKKHGVDVFIYNEETGKYDYNPLILNKTSPEKVIKRQQESLGNILIRKYEGAIGAGSVGVIDETLVTDTMLPIGIFNGNIPNNTKHLMAFEVVGDSMSPVIEERNWVIIDMVDNREYYPVDGIYLCNINSSYQIKRLQFLGTQGVEIISENSKYNTKNSKDCDVFEVIGKLYTIIKIGSGLALK